MEQKLDRVIDEFEGTYGIPVTRMGIIDKQEDRLELEADAEIDGAGCTIYFTVKSDRVFAEILPGTTFDPDRLPVNAQLDTNNQPLTIEYDEGWPTEDIPNA